MKPRRDARGRFYACKHLRVRHAEPSGPKSRGVCLDCGRFVASLPNTIPHRGWVELSKRRRAREKKT